MQLKQYLVILIGLLVFTIACQPEAEEQVQQIVLTNTADYDLTDKPIQIQRSTLNLPEGEKFPRLINSQGDTITSQLDDLDEDGRWDQFFFVINLQANEDLSLKLEWSDRPGQYPMRTAIRFGKRDSETTPVYPLTGDTLHAHAIPGRLGYLTYQTDGPSFENDKAGFRHYFDGRFSKDLFGKTISAMSPEDVGIGEGGIVEDNYHVMADWGRDVLSTANAVGLGGLAMRIGDQFVRLGNLAGDTTTNFDYAVFNIVQEGPVHSIVRFDYHNWQPLPGRNYQLRETVDIWPGMYAFHGQATLKGLTGDEELLVGLVNNFTDQPLGILDVNEKYTAYYTHDQQTYDKTWWLGMAVVVPKAGNVSSGDAPKEGGKFTTSYFATLAVENDRPVEYYALGAWELSDPGFKDSTYFVNHLKNFVDQLAAEVTVEVK